MKYGEFGESYCSVKCYKDAINKSISLKDENHTGICEFCKKPVRLGRDNDSSTIPYEGRNILICNKCKNRANNYFNNYFKCCNCKKLLNKGEIL